MRILVAEDDVKVRRHVVQALRSAGHAVDEAGDGEEALWLLRTHPFLLIQLRGNGARSHLRVRVHLDSWVFRFQR